MSIDSNQKGKEEVFLENYDAHSDAVFRYCLFKVSNYDEARDLTQETFTKVWQEIASGKDIENHKAFFFRVATNLIIDFYRKKKSHSLDRLQETGFDVPDVRNENLPEDSAEVRILKNALDELGETYREVVYLRYIEELSPKEIAQAVDLSENVVSVRIHRGLKELQKKMNN